VGLVAFNSINAHQASGLLSSDQDPPDPTTASQTFVTNLLKEIATNQAAKAERSFDLQFAFVRGNYYQVLHWLRTGRINAAVLSPFSYYVAREDEKDWPTLASQPVLEFPTAGFKAGEDGGAPYFRAIENGTAVKDPYERFNWCTHRDDDSCTFDFVNHLSTTGFIYPLMQAYEQPNAPSFSDILRHTQFALWHANGLAAPNTLPSIRPSAGCDPRTRRATPSHRRGRVTFQFTYAGNLAAKTASERAAWTRLLPDHNEFPHDVLVLNCKSAPTLLSGGRCNDISTILKSYVSNHPTKIAKPGTTPVGYLRAKTIANDDSLGQMAIEFKALSRRPDFAPYWQRWYERENYEFSVAEVVDVLLDDQLIAGHQNASIVLPGGGVRGAYQAGILDALYDGFVRNVNSRDDSPGVTGPRRLQIDSIVGTSGGALMGYLAARRAGPDDCVGLSDRWERGGTVVIQPSQVFPMFSVLRVLSGLLALTLLGGGAAMSSRRVAAAEGAPMFLTISFAALVVIAPALIWRLALVDVEYRPRWEAVCFTILIIALHAAHTMLKKDERNAPIGTAGSTGKAIATVAGILSVVLGLTVILDPAPLAAGHHVSGGPMSAALAVAFGALAVFCVAWLRGVDFDRKIVRAYGGGYLVLLVYGLLMVIQMLIWTKVIHRATILEMTTDYWIAVSVSSAIGTLLLVIVRVFSSQIDDGLQFWVYPLGSRPFPYTPILTLLIGGLLAVAGWTACVAPSLYDGERGVQTFHEQAESAGPALTRFFAAMTTLGTPTSMARQFPPGDYYAYAAEEDPGSSFPADGMQADLATMDRFLGFDRLSFDEAVSASGSPFPIYPGVLLKHRKGNGIFIDGGFTHLIPVEGAVLVGAKQVLVVANVARREASATGRGLWSLLLSDTVRTFDFLFDRSQMTDTNISHDVLVATIAPTWTEDNPSLMDFRPQKIHWLLSHARDDVENQRPARVSSWGEPHPFGAPSRLGSL
jgi:predicted acylesterase/phospholipase RssA